MATDELLLDREDSQVDEAEGRFIDGSTALMALSRSEIDVQISTAKRYPRAIVAFQRKALEMATLDEDTAGSMFYVLPRAGKKIEGPSVRMAEVVACSWGNLRYGARIIATDEKFITAQGACHDLETNIAVTYEVRRRITNKEGERYNDDMIQTTGNAACAIALREAIFKIVPRSMFKGIYEQARLTSVGKATSFNESRHKWVDWFKKAGATEAQVLGLLGHAGIEDITVEDIITLRGLSTAIKDGETTIEQAFGEDHSKGGKARKSPVTDKLKPQPAATAQEALDEHHGLQRPEQAPADNSKRHYPDPNSGIGEPFPGLAGIDVALGMATSDAAVAKAIDPFTSPDAKTTQEERTEAYRRGDVRRAVIRDRKSGAKQKTMV